MALPWWLMPGVIGGLMLYAKSKAAAAFRWINSDEASVMSMPVALLLTKLSSGDALPTAPDGFRWKSIEVSFASSPFVAPQTLQVNVMEAVPAPGPAPAIPGAVTVAPGAPTPAVNGFLTAQAVMNQGRGVHGFLTAQSVDAAARRGMGEVLRREQYLYAPQSAPDFGQMQWCGTGSARPAPLARPGVPGVLGQLGAELARKGLTLAPVGPHGICKGDYVVAADGSLHVAVGHNQFKQLHPTPGRVGPLPARFQAGFGVRRA